MSALAMTPPLTEPSIDEAYTELRDPERPIDIQRSLELRRYHALLVQTAELGMKAGVSMTKVYKQFHP